MKKNNAKKKTKQVKSHYKTYDEKYICFQHYISIQTIPKQKKLKKSKQC